VNNIVQPRDFDHIQLTKREENREVNGSKFLWRGRKVKREANDWK
jgi:hypothetical protein